MNQEDKIKEFMNADKWRYSLYGAILFVILALPATFGFTNSLKLKTLDNKGRLTIMGAVVHGIVYLLLIRLAMYLP